MFEKTIWASRFAKKTYLKCRKMTTHVRQTRLLAFEQNRFSFLDKWANPVLQVPWKHLNKSQNISEKLCFANQELLSIYCQEPIRYFGFLANKFAECRDIDLKILGDISLSLHKRKLFHLRPMNMAHDEIQVLYQEPSQQYGGRVFVKEGGR